MDVSACMHAMYSLYNGSWLENPCGQKEKGTVNNFQLFRCYFADRYSLFKQDNWALQIKGPDPTPPIRHLSTNKFPLVQVPQNLLTQKSGGSSSVHFCDFSLRRRHWYITKTGIFIVSQGLEKNEIGSLWGSWYMEQDLASYYLPSQTKTCFLPIRFVTLSPPLLTSYLHLGWIMTKSERRFFRKGLFHSLFILQTAQHAFGFGKKPICWQDAPQHAEPNLAFLQEAISMGLQCRFHMSETCRSSGPWWTLQMKDGGTLLLWNMKKQLGEICPLNETCQSFSCAIILPLGYPLNQFHF